MGYLFAFLAMLCFGMLGILSKLSDRRDCSPLMTTVCLFAASTVITAGAILFADKADFTAPGLVIGIALAFGVVTVLSSWVFLYGIRFGKITTSWVIINLSAAVPAVASAVIYGEKISPKRVLLLLLVAGAVLLLWKDMQDERKALEPTRTVPTGEKKEVA